MAVQKVDFPAPAGPWYRVSEWFQTERNFTHHDQCAIFAHVGGLRRVMQL